MKKIAIILLYCQFLFGCSNWTALYAQHEQLNFIQLKKFECIHCNHEVHYASMHNLERVLNTSVEHRGKRNTYQKYSLEVIVRNRITPIAIQSNSVATRSKIFAELEYTLIDNSNGQIIARNRITNVETLPVLMSTFSNALVEEEATQDMIKQLFEDLKLELLALIS